MKAKGRATTGARAAARPKYERRPPAELRELMKDFRTPFAAVMDGAINPEEYLWLEDKTLH